MANTETKKVKYLDAAIETMVDYKRGLRTLDTGAKELAAQTGLDHDVARELLKSMYKHNVTQIRGYTKEPDRLRQGKIGTPSETKRK
jgi:hypothetical protein|tara:strand:- start:873 stop:1133 length:261 start_codon:yes stop_codon:yes gene_type:complete